MPQIKKFENQAEVLVRMEKSLVDRLNTEAAAVSLSRNDYIVRMLNRIALQDEMAKNLPRLTKK